MPAGPRLTVIIVHDQWITLPIDGYAVQSVELRFFYELGGHIAALRRMVTDPGLWDTGAVSQALATLETAARSKTLPVIAEAASDLAMLLQDMELLLPGERVFVSPDKADSAKLRREIDGFESIFLAQLKTIHAYRVTPTLLLDPAALIESPERAFEEHWQHVPVVAQSDWKSACRCLAFDLPTASGFHVLRCLEAVALSYIEKLNLPRPGKRDLYTYLEVLRQNGADPNKIDAAQRIRALYRNPLMHPEDTLSERDAADLLSLCMAMMHAFLDEMQSQGLFGPTPTVAP